MSWISGDKWDGKSKKEPKKQKEVYFHVLRCPDCNSERTSVYSTVRPIRYHICRDCGSNFKSVEKDYKSNRS